MTLEEALANVDGVVATATAELDETDLRKFYLELHSLIIQALALLDQSDAIEGLGAPEAP